MLSNAEPRFVQFVNKVPIYPESVGKVPGNGCLYPEMGKAKIELKGKNLKKTTGEKPGRNFQETKIFFLTSI